ncbi:hypothetical protein IZ6_25650 [Terrihabitans soli]|uniref:Uncharacterized protein n=1 Tax=Terrihabitans soli TaxID=708113 RepID=A0A6S6QXR2_9HYPH|nr:hypothetical protein [Terrihabitans soli]BCJ91830.1 hypothetical protein IZ6_25650 [Terrihabitans soli]
MTTNSSLPTQVQFMIPEDYAKNPRALSVLNDALGITAEEVDKALRYNNAMKVVCTTAQFGVFIILREHRGVQNLVKCLNAKFHPHDSFTDVIDVSARS